MGLIESRKIKSAIASDGLQNIKIFAFVQSSLKYLDQEKIALTKDWEIALEEKIQQRIQFIQQQKQQCQKLLNMNVELIQQKNPDFIDKLEAKMKKSLKELTGYKKVLQQLQLQKNKSYKDWILEMKSALSGISPQVERVKEKLLKETAQTPKLNKLQDQTKQKVIAQFIQDPAYDIEREKYHRRAINQLQKTLNFNKMYQDRFQYRNPKQEILKIVSEFKDNLDRNLSYSTICGFGC